MSADQRDGYWDAVKGILISLVVVGHFFQMTLSNLGIKYPLIEALLCTIYSFHMPLFVFVSGLFSRDANKCRSKALEGLLVPLVVLQAVWIIWITVTEGISSALSAVLYPQFALWYLAALYIWRTLLPDFCRIRHILAISLSLFFIGKVVGGLDNLFGLDRTVGFLLFFILGYQASREKRFMKVVRAIPVPVAVGTLLICPAFLWRCFSSGVARFETVFYTFTHSQSVWQFSTLWGGVVAYILALVAAALLSGCVLRLALAAKKDGPLSSIGRDTMPLYAIHGFVIHAACYFLARIGMGQLSQLAIIALLLLLSVIVVAALSSGFVRKRYRKSIQRVSCIIINNEARSSGC